MAPAAAFGPAGASWGWGSGGGQELRGQRVGDPPLPVLGSPALLDDQQPVKLVAGQAENYVGGPRGVEPVAQATVGGQHGNEVAVALQRQGVVAIALGGDV